MPNSKNNDLVQATVLTVALFQHANVLLQAWQCVITGEGTGQRTAIPGNEQLPGVEMLAVTKV